MKTVRLGIIGLGYIGQKHLRNGTKLQHAQVLAASDVSRKALVGAKNAGVRKTFTDYKQMLKDPAIDAVVIGLPTHLHLECAKAAAEAGKHIFLEKPIARNVAEAKEIVSVANKNSIKLMIGYPLRFNKEFCELKNRISDGTLGDVETAHALYVGFGPFFHRAEGYAPTPVPEWWFNKELTGGGVLIDLGSHVINLLRWYFGEISDIKAHFKHRFNMDFEDTALCLAKFKNKTTAVINVGWFTQEYGLKVELFGSVKHAVAQHAPQNPFKTVVQVIARGRAEFFEPHFSELEYFVNCLNQDRNPSPTGQDGIRDMEAIARAYENKIELE